MAELGQSLARAGSLGAQLKDLRWTAAINHNLINEDPSKNNYKQILIYNFG